MISLMKNYYKILDIPDNADSSEIEKAYTKLKNLITKNSVSLYSILPSSEKETFLRDIEEAYQTLKIPERRSLYDLKLKGLADSYRPESADQISRQLTFEFASEAFTFLDYTKKNEDIYIDAIDRIRSDYLLESSGPSIKIIEGVQEKTEDETLEDIDTANPSIQTIPERKTDAEDMNRVGSEDEKGLEKISTPQEQASSIEAIEKTEPVVIQSQNTGQVSSEVPENAYSPQTTETPATSIQKEVSENECKDKIIIDENSEFSGSFLKRIRESMGITIKDIARITKISTANITNIEEERYGDLPALVYVKGYLAQIAKCLNLRSDIVVRSYLQRMNESTERKIR